MATLAVVLAATWWSGAQRPAGQAVLAATPMPTANQVADTAVQRLPALLTTTAAGGAAAAVATTTWPAQATNTLAREGLQAVGYQARSHR